MVDKDKIKSRRIRDLLYLQSCIDNAIREEVQETLRERPSDIIDRIKYILDESMLGNSEVLRSTKNDTISDIVEGRGLKPLSPIVL